MLGVTSLLVVALVATPGFSVDITKMIIAGVKAGLGAGFFPDGVPEKYELLNQAASMLVDRILTAETRADVSSNLGDYDFVFDIGNLSTLSDYGWPLFISPRCKQFRSNPAYSANLKYIPIVAVMGHYSKGKSFVVKHMINAAMATEHYVYATENEISIAEGAGVTTRGISGVFAATKKDDLSTTRLVLLDMAGRNSPAPRWKKGRSWSLVRRVRAMRLKERIIDDVALQIADVIVYVVDELLNEDQRVLLHMLENLDEGRSVVLIHNFKRIKGETEEATVHMKEQIVEAFGAEKVEWTADEQKNYPSFKLFTSQWSQASGKTQTIMHYAIFANDNSASWNKQAFQHLQKHLFNLKISTSRTVANAINSTIVATEKVLSRLARRVPVQGTGDLESHEQPASYRDATIVVRPSGRVRFVPTPIFDDMVPIPKIESSGKSSLISELHKNRTHFIITVEMPGFSSDHALAKIPEEDSKKRATSWFAIIVDTEGDDHYVKVHLQGNHALGPPPSFERQRKSGSFAEEFLVPFRYAPSDPRITIEHGLLTISFSTKPLDIRVEL